MDQILLILSKHRAPHLGLPYGYRRIEPTLLVFVESDIRLTEHVFATPSHLRDSA